MAMRREPGGHSNRDRHRFMNSWPLFTTDDMGHVPDRHFTGNEE